MKKKKVKIEFDTYGSPVEPEEKGNVLKKLWSKTIFPDKIKAKKEEKKWKKELETEAKIEVREELKDEYKKLYKQMELDKLKGKKTGKGKNMLDKLANEFKGLGDSIGNKDIGALMGGSSSGRNNLGTQMGIGTGLTNEKLTGMFSLGERQLPVTTSKIKKSKKKKKGKKTKYVEQSQKNNIESFEDKMKRMLS